MKKIHPKKDHPIIVKYLNDLGIDYKNRGECKLAIDTLQKSLDMGERIYKGDHPSIAQSLNNLGLAWVAEKEYDKAIKSHLRSVGMWERIYQGYYPHTNIAQSLYNLGVAYLHNKQHSEAIDCFEKLLKLMNSQDQHNLEGFAILYHNLAINYQEIGVYDEAIKYSTQALHMISKFPGHPFENCIKSTLIELIGQCTQKQTICDRLADLTKENQKSIELWLAITENNVTEVQKLADSRVDLNYASFMNTTPLIQAVKTGNVAMVSALLSGNIDINKPNSNQDQASPLYCSLGWCGQPINIAIVELLLKNDANVNQPMYDGDTPMHMAHYSGHKAIISLLRQYGANINAQNEQGKTPLHCLLEDKGINSETKLEIIQEFLTIYDMTIKDKANKTVVDYATEHCPESLSLLDNELLTTSAISTSVNMDDINVTLLADIDLSKTNQDLPNT